MNTQNYLPLWNEKKNYRKHSRIRFESNGRKKSLTRKKNQINSKNREKKEKNAKCPMYWNRRKGKTTRKKKEDEEKNVQSASLYVYTFDIARQTEIFTFFNRLQMHKKLKLKTETHIVSSSFLFRLLVHRFIRFLRKI